MTKPDHYVDEKSHRNERNYSCRRASSIECQRAMPGIPVRNGVVHEEREETPHGKRSLCTSHGAFVHRAGLQKAEHGYFTIFPPNASASPPPTTKNKIVRSCSIWNTNAEKVWDNGTARWKESSHKSHSKPSMRSAGKGQDQVFAPTTRYRNKDSAGSIRDFVDAGVM